MLVRPGNPDITYGEMMARAGEMASALRATGAKPGDRIVVQVEKSAENVAAYLGAMRAGLIFVPLNTAYTDDEVRYFLNDASPSIFVSDPAREPTLKLVARDAGVKTVLTLSKDSRASGRLSQLADTQDTTAPPQSRAGNDLAAILYTSGTTGRSKGAMLSHDALRNNAEALKSLWGMSGHDKLLHALPIFHIHGLFVALHTAMLASAKIIFLPKFDVIAVRQVLPRTTIMMGVPTFYSRLLKEPAFDSREVNGVRLFISGSAPLTQDVFDAFETRTGKKILERYGMSEAGMIASNPLDGERIAGTVGYAVPDAEIRITDTDGRPLPAGQTGQVEIKSNALFSGYWRMPEKTAEEFNDGWFVTGDVGTLDETGRLRLSGRQKDLIIAGGYNIYPPEIEAILDRIPGVTESAVVGAPHGDMGEGVVAVLVANDPHQRPTQAIIDEALGSLARFKRPRRFYWTDSLPRNAMGKVQKQLLRQQFKTAFSKGDV